MKVTINGECREIPGHSVLRDLVPTGPGIAVALNGDVVHAAAQSGAVLRDGDRIEIVCATQGG